jgi:hypothetical protein
MNTLTKARPSKLAPFEETLFAMEVARKTLAEMRQWLGGHGVTVTIVAISKFLASRRKLRWQAEILGQIVNGLQPVAQAKSAFQNQPDPDLDTLIKLSRIFIFEQATKLMTGPEYAAQSSKTTKMVLNYINSQAKQGIRKSEIALAEKKLAAHAPDHPPKQCPDNTKMDSEAGELLRAAVPAPGSKSTGPNGPNKPA